MADPLYLLMVELERTGTTEKDGRAWFPATINGERMVTPRAC